MTTLQANIASIVTESLKAFKPKPLTQIVNNLPPHAFDDRDYRKAAVYAILDDAARVLVIQKPCYNDGYPWGGQIAFPGGHVEKDDGSFLQAALREVSEEVGITGRQLDTIGSLGCFPTIRQVSIEAFIGFINGPVDPKPQDSEVACVMWASLADLLRTHLTNGYINADVSVNELLYPIGDLTIWGATARIIQFLFNTVLTQANYMLNIQDLAPNHKLYRRPE